MEIIVPSALKQQLFVRRHFVFYHKNGLEQFKVKLYAENSLQTHLLLILNIKNGELGILRLKYS